MCGLPTFKSAFGAGVTKRRSSLGIILPLAGEVARAERVTEGCPANDRVTPLPHCFVMVPLPSQGRIMHRSHRHTASESEVKVKSRSFIGGMTMVVSDSSLFTRTGLPNSSTLLSMMTGLSLKRKFFTGYLIWPFSM